MVLPMQRFVVIVHDAGLDLGDHVRALPGDLGIRIFHLCRARALLRGERKRTDALELEFLQKVTQLLRTPPRPRREGR